MSNRSFLTNFAHDYLETLNLRRFFGDYRTFAFSSDTFHLGIGEIANITDPTTWQSILQAVNHDDRLISRATMYSGTRGEQEANQAMAEHVGELLGRPDFDESHIVPYDGGHNAINGILRACVAPLGSTQDERQYVLLPTPCYPYFSTILTLHSGVIAYTAYSAEDMVCGIEEFINPQIGVVLINTPHNPTGYTLTPKQVERINQAVEPYDCIIAVDMVYALNALDPSAIQALGQLDSTRTIYVDSFSKKFGLPGFRLGYAACANSELIEALRMMKAAESISTSNVKLLLGTHLLKQHMAIAEMTAAEIRQRYHVFRQALNGIEEYGVEIPEPSSHANSFYLPLFLDRLLAHTGLSADAFSTVCQERYHLEIVPGTRMYPPIGTSLGTLTQHGGKTRISSPGAVIYAPAFSQQQRPFLRVSFGIETRLQAAAEQLQQACADAFTA